MESKTPYWITMTRKSSERGKIWKYVVGCQSWLQAERVLEQAKELQGLQEVKRINFRTTKPYYIARTHRTKYFNQEEWQSQYIKLKRRMYCTADSYFNNSFV